MFKIYKWILHMKAQSSKIHEPCVMQKLNVKLEYQHVIATNLDVNNTFSKWIASYYIFVIRLGYVVKVSTN